MDNPSRVFCTGWLSDNSSSSWSGETDNSSSGVCVDWLSDNWSSCKRVSPVIFSSSLSVLEWNLQDYSNYSDFQDRFHHMIPWIFSGFTSSPRKSSSCVRKVSLICKTGAVTVKTPLKRSSVRASGVDISATSKAIECVSRKFFNLLHFGQRSVVYIIIFAMLYVPLIFTLILNLIFSYRFCTGFVPALHIVFIYIVCGVSVQMQSAL